jgi:hypothetical protein
MTSSSGLRGHRRTYLTILESADHALFRMVSYVLLRPLRPELDVIQNNCRVRFVGISRYVHFRALALIFWGINFSFLIKKSLGGTFTFSNCHIIGLDTVDLVFLVVSEHQKSTV